MGQCEEVTEKVCKDVKIRVVPDVVKYDYPAEHSSAPTYEDDSARGKRSIEKKLERLQDKIDRKFDQAYEKLIKKEKDSAPWTTETEQPWSKTKEPEQPWTVPVETERVCEEVPQTKCTVVPREECHTEEHDVCKDVERQDCKSVPLCKKHAKKECWMEPKEKCVKLPEKECWEEPREECWDEKKEVRTEYDVRSCHPVPFKDCQKVVEKRPREVCIPPATKTKIETTKVKEW